MLYFRSTLALLVITFLSGVSSGAQILSTAGPGTTAGVAPSALNPAPQYLLYHLLFRHLAALQNAAQSGGVASAPSAGLSRVLVYKHVLALNDAEYQTLLSVAKACEDSVAQDDTKARAIIHNAVEALQQQLPSASTSKINKFIDTHFGPRSQIQHLAIPQNSKTEPAARARMNQAISSSQPGGQQ